MTDLDPLSRGPKATTDRERSRSGAADRGRRPRTHRSRTGLRRAFFALAAIWGFVLGSGAIAGVSAAVGRPIELAWWLLLVLGGALLLAVLGGLAAATVYRRAASRR